MEINKLVPIIREETALEHIFVTMLQNVINDENQHASIFINDTESSIRVEALRGMESFKEVDSRDTIPAEYASKLQYLRSDYYFIVKRTETKRYFINTNIPYTFLFLAKNMKADTPIVFTRNEDVVIGVVGSKYAFTINELELEKQTQ